MSMGAPGDESTVVAMKLVALSDPVHVGLEISAHNAEEVETAVFSNVRIE